MERQNRFKAGDVVTPSCHVPGVEPRTEYVVEDNAGVTRTGHWITLRGNRNPITFDGSYKEGDFDLVRSAGVMQIETGKHYRTACGKKVGPMAKWHHEGLYCVNAAPFDGGLWKPDGTPRYPRMSDSPTLVAEWAEFKAGDKVVCTVDLPGQFTAGKAYVVSKVGDFSVSVAEDDEGDPNGWSLGHFEPAPTPTFKIGDRISGVIFGDDETATGVVVEVDTYDPDGTYAIKPDMEHPRYGNYIWLTTSTCVAAPIVVEAGKHYRLEGGDVIGPMKSWYDTDFILNFGDGDVWHADGRGGEMNCTLGSIVAEAAAPVAAEPAAEAARPAGFKVGDRVKALAGLPEGMTGTVALNDSDGTVLVEFEGLTEGHAGALGGYALGTSGWWLFPYELALVAPTHAIVALIENGQPKPSARPRIHPDRATALAEAERLARKDRGKVFGVYELVSTRKVAAPVYQHEWQRLAAAGSVNMAATSLAAVAGIPRDAAKRIAADFREAA